MKNKIWLITGSSSGIGLALTKYLLEKNRNVAAITRNPNRLLENLGTINTKRILPLKVDLYSHESIQETVYKVRDYFGSIDVLVNNAGYEQTGYIEEFKENLEVNLFFPIRLIKNVIPIMRRKKTGYIINISSIGGNCYSWPGSYSYNISKVGLDSLSKTLYSEVRDFGIFSTSVIAGQFRTNFFEHIMYPSQSLSVYDLYREQKLPKSKKDKHSQRGDIQKFAKLLFELSELENPPINIYAGEDAYGLAYNKAISILKNLERWESISRHLDINEPKFSDFNK